MQRAVWCWLLIVLVFDLLERNRIAEEKLREREALHAFIISQRDLETSGFGGLCRCPHHPLCSLSDNLIASFEDLICDGEQAALPLLRIIDHEHESMGGLGFAPQSCPPAPFVNAGIVPRVVIVEE